MSDTATPDSVAALAGTKHDLGCRCWPHYSPQAVTDAFAAGRKEGADTERAKWSAAIASHTITLTRPALGNFSEGVDVVPVHDLRDLLGVNHD